MIHFKNKTPGGYSQMVEIDLGNCTMLILSGQVAIDHTGKSIGKDDLPTQMNFIFKKIKIFIEQSGGTMNDIVKLDVFMLDISQLHVFRTVRDQYINVDNPPASTALGVSALAREELLVEIEAAAVIAKK
jgi:enamine deaminase RidA (YjgF/YER057c/UK114 family)